MLKVSGEREMERKRWPALSDSAHTLNPNKTKKHWGLQTKKAAVPDQMAEGG